MSAYMNEQVIYTGDQQLTYYYYYSLLPLLLLLLLLHAIWVQKNHHRQASSYLFARKMLNVNATKALYTLSMHNCTVRHSILSGHGLCMVKRNCKSSWLTVISDSTWKLAGYLTSGQSGQERGGPPKNYPRPFWAQCYWLCLNAVPRSFILKSRSQLVFLCVVRYRPFWSSCSGPRLGGRGPQTTYSSSAPNSP